MALVVCVLVIAAVNFTRWKGRQREIEASAALLALPSIVSPTRLAVTNVSSAGYEKVARDFPGTQASFRASILVAGLLFSEGKYKEARDKFELISKEKLSDDLMVQAEFGVAASTDAAGNASEALKKYQEVVSRFSGTPASSQSKMAMARIHEGQNKPEEALKLYESFSSTNPYDSWAAEARDKRERLLVKNPQLIKAPAASTTNNFSGSTNLLVPAARP